jgi:hypothetical protein
MLKGHKRSRLNRSMHLAVANGFVPANAAAITTQIIKRHRVTFTDQNGTFENIGWACWVLAQCLSVGL